MVKKLDTFKSVFSKPEYQIPIVFETNDLKNEVNKLLTKYIDDLIANNVNSMIVNKIKRFRKSCSFTLSNYLKGIHSNAFKNFEKAISALDIENSPMLSETLGDDVLFRGRINSGNNDFQNDEMYHIPLSKRGIISTQRYSFPGLPCLYVGASVYTCWVEINRPSFEEFQVATIKPTKCAQDKKVFNLCNIPQRLDELRGKNWFDENEYFLYWPLLAMCSIKVYEEKDTFKPEYIFPQFMLEHILKNKKSDEYIGIKYVSNKVASICNKQLEGDWHTYVNYVFPSHSDSMIKKQCDSLSSMLKIDHNRSGKDLNILTRILEADNVKVSFKAEEEEPSQYDLIQSELGKRHIYTKDEMDYSYGISVFGMMELAMRRTNFDDIEDDQYYYEIKRED